MPLFGANEGGQEARNENISAVQKQNQLEFRSALSYDEDVRKNPALLAERMKTEKKLARLVSEAKRLDLRLGMPGNAQKTHQGIQKYLGEVNEHNQIETLGDKKKSLRYGRIVIGRLKGVYAEDRIQGLTNAFEGAEEEDPHYRIMQEIVEGRGDGLHVPTTDDPEEFAEEIDAHRYLMTSTKDLGVIRVSVKHVQYDLAKFNNGLPLSNEAKKFQRFLTGLAKADPIQHYEHIILPKYAKRYEPESVRNAKGALKLLLLAGLVTGGAISLIMERDEEFPTVAAIYLGLATIVAKPNLFKSGPLERMRKTLGFVVPPEGGRDLWSELMKGPSKENFAGEKGEILFEELLESDAQRASKKRNDPNANSETYYKELDESDVSSENIQALRDLEIKSPELFHFIVANTAKVKVPADKIALLQLVRASMTGDRIVKRIAKPPVKNNPNLGGFGALNLQRP